MLWRELDRFEVELNFTGRREQRGGREVAGCELAKVGGAQAVEKILGVGAGEVDALPVRLDCE